MRIEVRYLDLKPFIQKQLNIFHAEHLDKDAKKRESDFWRWLRDKFEFEIETGNYYDGIFPTYFLEFKSEIKYFEFVMKEFK